MEAIGHFDELRLLPKQNSHPISAALEVEDQHSGMLFILVAVGSGSYSSSRLHLLDLVEMDKTSHQIQGQSVNAQMAITPSFLLLATV